MVLGAKRAYRDFPTVVNEIPESGLTYDNNLCEYARMDNIMQGAQKSIGGASDTAQLALSYYFNNVYKGIYNEDTKSYYDIFVILAVLAQCSIDGCKRLYAVNVNDEIKRIRSMKCMSMEKDYPKFMKYTSKIPSVKNGKPRPYEDISRDKGKVDKRIDKDIVCPMNWMQDNLEKIQMAQYKYSEDINNYLIGRPKEKTNNVNKQMRKIRKIIEDFDALNNSLLFIIDNNDDGNENNDILEMLSSKTQEVFDAVSKMNIHFYTMYRLIESSLGCEHMVSKRYKYASKYAMKTLNVLYHANPKMFLSCFVCGV